MVGYGVGGCWGDLTRRPEWLCYGRSRAKLREVMIDLERGRTGLELDDVSRKMSKT